MIKHSRAYLLSQEILCRLGTDAFPLNVFLAAKQACPLPVVFMTLSEYRGRIQIQDDLLVKDALCICRPGRGYLILYNEKQSKKRIRFSIAHELGHIMLGHLEDGRTEISGGGLDDYTYFTMEGEANTFAGNFLAPPILIDAVVRATGRMDPALLANIFYLSQQAIKEYRLEDYRNWKQQSPHALEQTLLARCRQSLYLYRCDNCGQTAADEYAFCPVCGQSAMQAKKWGERAAMQYPGIDLDAYGRTKVCPVCGSDELLAGQYCHICGTLVVNACTGNCERSRKTALPGNARYCPDCGSQTTFFRDGFLTQWQEAFTEDIAKSAFDLSDEFPHMF